MYGPIRVILIKSGFYHMHQYLVIALARCGVTVVDGCSGSVNGLQFLQVCLGRVIDGPSKLRARCSLRVAVLRQGSTLTPAHCHLWSRGPFHQRSFIRNSNSLEILYCSCHDFNTMIATKFCTWYDSCAVTAHFLRSDNQYLNYIKGKCL